ncbi:hypothetical protein D3C73_1144930 [compost metagenome]
MAVKQNNFWYLFTGDLSLATQAQHVFGVISLALVSDSSLARKEWLKTFTLQVIKQSNSRNVCVPIAAGFMLFFAEHTWHVMRQFVAG